MADSSYTVGYGRPPQHTRFQKGQSGNPGGKPGPKKLLKRDFDRALCKALDGDEKSFREGRPGRLVDILVRRTVIQALDGKLPALKLILSVLEKGDCDLSAEEEPLAAGASGEEHATVHSLTQGNSQGFSAKDGAVKCGAARLPHLREEEFNRRYEAACAAGRFDGLFGPARDESDTFEKRFDAACDAGLFDDILTLDTVPFNSLAQNNSLGIPQKNGHAQT